MAEFGNECIGFLLTGEARSDSWLDTHHGKTTVVWIDWVEQAYRKQGHGIGMLEFARAPIVEMGFETATMAVLEENKAGQELCLAFGAIPSERLYVYPIPREEPHG